MPKIQVAELMVRDGQLPNARVQVNADPMAFGVGQARAAERIGESLQSVGNLVHQRQMEFQKEQDQAKVLDASTRYQQEVNTLLYGEKGLMNKFGGEAVGITSKAAEEIQKIRERYSTGLGNPEQQRIFNNYATSSSMDISRELSKHEAKERRDYLIKGFQGMADTEGQTAVFSSDPNALPNYATKINERSQEIFGSSYGQDFAKAQAASYVQKAYREKAKQIGSQDPQAALDFIDKNPDKFEQEERSVLTDSFKGRVSAAKTTTDASKYLDMAGGDIEKAIQMSRDERGKGTPMTFTDFKSRITTQESGGNYEAVNGRTGAFGKFQIMPENWVAWSKEAGLPDGSPMSPVNQEKVFDHKMGYYFSKYGPDGAAVAWYAGEGNAKRWIEGKATAIGDNGQEYSWDAKQGSGNEPSVREYVNDTTGGATNKPGRTDLEQEQLEGKIMAAFTTRQHITNIKKADELDRVRNAIANATPTSAIDIINGSSLDPWTKKTLIGHVATENKVKSNVDSVVQLMRLEANGDLKEQDVHNMASKGLLSAEDYQKYLGKSFNIAANRQDKVSSSADKRLIEYAENYGDFKGDKPRVNLFIAESFARMDREGVKGDARYDRGMELYKQEATTKESVAKYTLNNNAERAQIATAFPGLFPLAEAGFRNSGKWGGDYWEINQFLSDLGSRAESDPKVQEAIDWAIKNNRALTPESFAKIYATFNQ